MDLIWDKVLKNKPIKICGRQPLKIFLKAVKFYLVDSWMLCLTWMFSEFRNLFLDLLLNILNLCFICDVLRRLNNKENFLATWWCFFITVIYFDKVRSQISFWSHDTMSPRRSLKLKGKKHQNIYFATQHRIINIRIRIKHSKFQFFALWSR